MNMLKGKHKDKKFKAVRKKMTHHILGNTNKAMSRHLCWNFAGQEGIEEYVQSAKRKNLQLKLLYLVELAFRNEGAIKTLQAKQKLRHLIITSPAWQEMINGVLPVEIKKH